MRSAQIQLTTHVTGMLAVALELSKKRWKVAISDGRRDNPSLHTVDGPTPAERIQAVVNKVRQQMQQWGLDETCPISVVFEAGQDGLWIAHAMRKLGYQALPIDPASIPVPRKSRRAKTDRLDAIKLVNSLLGWLRGEKDRMRVLHIPTPEEEDQRQLVRSRGDLLRDVCRFRDRITKLLSSVGCWAVVDPLSDVWLEPGALRDYDGKPLKPGLLTRLRHDREEFLLAVRLKQQVEMDMRESLPEPQKEQIRHLQQLKGIGEVGATRLVLELFWRHFDNRREVGACVGLVPQPFDSGESRVDQGISKQGNRRVRALLVEMAWCWLRYQPNSELSRWFVLRTQGGGKRGRRVMIVAVARKLVIALWRLLELGEIPAGAVCKP